MIDAIDDLQLLDPVAENTPPQLMDDMFTDLSLHGQKAAVPVIDYTL